MRAPIIKLQLIDLDETVAIRGEVVIKDPFPIWHTEFRSDVPRKTLTYADILDEVSNSLRKQAKTMRMQINRKGRSCRLNLAAWTDREETKEDG